MRNLPENGRVFRSDCLGALEKTEHLTARVMSGWMLDSTMADAGMMEEGEEPAEAVWKGNGRG